MNIFDNYQERIDELESEIVSLEEDIEKLEKEIDELEEIIKTASYNIADTINTLRGILEDLGYGGLENRRR